MMNVNGELVLRISPETCKITVEEQNGPIMSRKEISANALFSCLRESVRIDGMESGLLPPDCLAITQTPQRQKLVTRCAMDYMDISFYETTYPHFPLPRLVFGYTIEDGGRVSDCRLGVMADERPRPETPMYHYPFSNVGSSGHLCIGSNELPCYKSLYKAATLPALLLSIPNNLHQYDKKLNQLGLEYRDLLAHLQDKTPAYYYEKVLIKNGKTLADFIAGK